MSNFFSWLESTSLALGIRQSMWLYPALEIVHIVGIVLLVGAAFMFDLRLLGFSKSLPLQELSNHLLPWSARGLILIAPSGILLFITNAKSLGVDPTFWLKMILLGIAALNVLVFHKFIFKKNIEVSSFYDSPISVKISAFLSIIIWIAIIACGRLLAY
ncbi:hypothetical protein H8S90_00935 [Olivibacter sp. SDN3]|uniref:DUF6644 family protein n=1 Tax=Olivibacter sp. SDN3 TaxID=2764720 RepID=UPI0016516BAC|nr:DUF6644 family protein [Olivibacter sp. SDN3]QNL50230.1 hypothetical protein H8S90_00935 [Olivibacter sp. SDN3]